MTHSTRRTVLAVIASGVTGAAVATGGSERASAAVTLDQFSAADHETALRGTPSDVRVSCETGYRWEIPDGQARPNIWQVRLYAGESDTRISKADGRAGGRGESGTATIAGSVLDADSLAASDFEPASEPVAVDVPLRLELEVVGDNKTLAAASKESVGTVTVTQAAYQASLHGSVGGKAEFTVSE